MAVVFDACHAGDQTSASIINAGAEHIASLISNVSTGLALSGPIVAGGGLALHQPLLQDAPRTRLQAAGLQDVRFLDRDPVMGVEYLLEHQVR